MNIKLRCPVCETDAYLGEKISEQISRCVGFEIDARCTECGAIMGNEDIVRDERPERKDNNPLRFVCDLP